MKTTSAAPEAAREITAAAKAFLSTLSAEKRDEATFEFESEERRNWHYIPRARKGVPRGAMDGRASKAAGVLLASSLSETGVRKATAIVQHELILGRAEQRQGVRRFERDPGLYFFSVFGDPQGGEPWGWRVEGHHLSVNVTVVDGNIVSATPSFFGANPAEVRHGPQKGLRILREEEDLARELYSSLDPAQRDRAVLYPGAPADLITRASPRVHFAEAVGAPAEAMSADQRETLVALIGLYIDKKPHEVAVNARRKIEAEGIGNIRFGWAGGQHRGQEHYYRIHGPSFFVEYDNTQDRANHIHSVWRDIHDDFGTDVLRSHYQRDHR